MTYLNMITLEGNLTKDAEVKNISSNSVVTTFNIAHNESFMDSNKELVKRVFYIGVEVWGESFANKISNYLKKGTCVRVYGKLKCDSWTSDDGTKKERLVIRATNIDFVQYYRQNGKMIDTAKTSQEIDDIEIIETDIKE